MSGLVIAMMLAQLDNMIVSPALPTIVGELGGLNHLSWVVTGYILASTVSTPIWGKLGDMGKRAEYYRRALAALGKADSTPLLALKRKIAAEAAVVPASGNSSPPH